MGLLPLALLVFCFQLAHFTDPPCVVELQCAECVPDNMPLVTSHAEEAARGRVTLAHGAALALSCGAGRFLAYPLRASLEPVCEAGRYRLHDGALLHLLELGCQESIFEDVLHQVDECAPPLQGRAYLMRTAGAPRHLASVCFDSDRAAPVRLHMTSAAGDELLLAPHADASSPLSILGNFNHMFDEQTRRDTERLYSNDERMNRRLHEQFKHEHFSFAEQTLTSAKLLSEEYFLAQHARAADFMSNRVGVWRSVAAANLRHLQRDVRELLRAARRASRALDVYSGTHGTLALRTDGARTDVFLRARRRFPVPRYVWTVVHEARARRALALVLLNDPFVAVSDIRGAVFCDSACGRVAWLRDLRRQRRYETPLYGLVFCCALHNFTGVVTEMPDIDVPPGDEGMLTELFV